MLKPKVRFDSDACLLRSSLPVKGYIRIGINTPIYQFCLGFGLSLPINKETLSISVSTARKTDIRPKISCPASCVIIVLPIPLLDVVMKRIGKSIAGSEFIPVLVRSAKLIFCRVKEKLATIAGLNFEVQNGLLIEPEPAVNPSKVIVAIDKIVSCRD